jgi:hypothetical protein
MSSAMRTTSALEMSAIARLPQRVTSSRLTRSAMAGAVRARMTCRWMKIFCDHIKPAGQLCRRDPLLLSLALARVNAVLQIPQQETSTVARLGQ